METLAGYRRVLMCEAVRDEVAANLGPGADVCRRLLEGVTANRLMLTPWLNQVGVLHLRQNPPRLLSILRRWLCCRSIRSK